MKIVCYGDSNTFGYDPSSLFGEAYASGSTWTDRLGSLSGWEIVNEGVNGREVPDEPVTFLPDAEWILIMLGTNNLLQFWSPGETAEKMKVFLHSVEYDRERIILIAPPAMSFGAWVEDQELIDDSVKLAEEFRVVAEEMNIKFIDASRWGIPMAFDGVHFTMEGHHEFAERLYQVVSKIEK